MRGKSFDLTLPYRLTKVVTRMRIKIMTKSVIIVIIPTIWRDKVYDKMVDKIINRG